MLEDTPLQQLVRRHLGREVEEYEAADSFDVGADLPGEWVELRDEREPAVHLLEGFLQRFERVEARV